MKLDKIIFLPDNLVQCQFISLLIAYQWSFLNFLFSILTECTGPRHGVEADADRQRKYRYKRAIEGTSTRCSQKSTIRRTGASQNWRWDESIIWMLSVWIINLVISFGLKAIKKLLLQSIQKNLCRSNLGKDLGCSGVNI